MAAQQRRKIFIRILVSALLVSFFLARTDISTVALSFGKFSLFIILLSASLYIFAFWIASLKWKILLPEYPLRSLFKLNLIGLFYSTVLPGQISGELVKAYRLSKNNTEAEKIVASVWVDKITGLLGLFLVGVMGIFLSPTHLPQSLVAAVILAAFLCFVLLFFIRLEWCSGLIFKALRGCSFRFPRSRPLASKLSLFITMWREYLHHKWLIFFSVIAGILFQLIAVTIVMVLANGAGIPISFWDWCWIFGIVSVALLLPITIGGLGLRDGVLVGLLVWLSVPPEPALALSLSLFGLQVFGAAIGATIEIFTSRTRI